MWLIFHSEGGVHLLCLCVDDVPDVADQRGLFLLRARLQSTIWNGIATEVNPIHADSSITLVNKEQIRAFVCTRRP